MNVEIRPITADEIAPFRVEMSVTFGEDMTDEEIGDDERFRDLMPLARTLAAFDGDQIVGTFGDQEYDITVPGGGALSMAGTTMVTVRPTHTRRGLLREMMTLHLDVARERRDPVAGLWASESAIYGRFGFGSAAERHIVEVPSTIRFVDDAPAGTVRQVDAEAALALFPLVHERVRSTRPGVLHRDPLKWKWRFYDPAAWRGGKSARRYAMYDGAEGPEGYVAFRVKEEWTDLVTKGQVFIDELQAATPDAHAALWRHVTSIDLFPRIRYWNAPVDDELKLRIASPRDVNAALTDALWLRILDVESALAARSYVPADTLRIEVDDPMFDDISGVYELSSSDGVTCRKVDGEADISLGTAALSSMYLGGQSVASLARAGLVDGAQDALVAADEMFRWPIAPWCPEVF